MSAFFSGLSTYWTLAVTQLRSHLMLPQTEPADYPFAASDIAQLHRLTSDPAAPSLDAQTWNDLLLDRYLAQLSAQTSIFGQQVLHQRLRAGLGDADCAALGERLRTLMDDPAQLEQLHGACTAMRRADAEIAAPLFEQQRSPVPAWVRRTWLAPLGLSVSLSAVAWSPLAWIGAAIAMYFLMAIQVRFADRAEEWGRTVASIRMLLRTASLLGARGVPGFAADGARAGKINRSLERFPEVIPGLRGYADWFLLANVKHYFKCVDIVYHNIDFLRACFLRCASLEADVALARHLLRTPACRAERAGDGAIMLEQAVHPLLAQAVPLTLDLQGKGAFISGQNGVGKSTLLRTVGLNLAAARAFGFCYARSARVSARPVYASMQGEDSLLGGESLYVAELRRAQELLAAASGPHPAVFIIDEIFRGTNHLESVSAAAAVLDALAAKGLVIVASHNLVLAPLLAHRLVPLYVTAPGGDIARLALVPGVLAHTNGIALLGARGLGPQIEANAAKVFDWVSGYLARPAECGHILGSAFAPAQPQQSEAIH